jgi:MerR family mercuric resistance operon transcriptional regulator
MNRMTIGKLAAASGIKVTTIRFYERAGLMPMPARSAGRHRSYTSDHLRRLRFICRARELKFSIREIKILLALAEPARDSCREVQALAAAHVKELRKKVNDLMKLETMLSEAVERCSGEPAMSCPVLELLQRVD